MPTKLRVRASGEDQRGVEDTRDTQVVQIDRPSGHLVVAVDTPRGRADRRGAAAAVLDAAFSLAHSARLRSCALW